MTDQQWKEQVQGRPSFFAVAGHLSGPILDVTRGFIALQPDQCEDLGPELTISEWFAGAFAGWHRAVHALKRVLKRKANIRVLWSIDVDPHASHVYAENFGAEQRSRDRAFQKGCVFHHCQDVVQHDWISALEATPTDFAFVSPPCQCWSSAGWATGLLHKFGPVVLHSVMKLAYIRPHVIGLENVQGLRRHDHWPALLSLFEYVGFDLIWENEATSWTYYLKSVPGTWQSSGTVTAVGRLDPSLLTGLPMFPLARLTLCYLLKLPEPWDVTFLRRCYPSTRTRDSLEEAM